jgi:hypothetical protein
MSIDVGSNEFRPENQRLASPALLEQTLLPETVEEPIMDEFVTAPSVSVVEAYRSLNEIIINIASNMFSLRQQSAVVIKRIEDLSDEVAQDDIVILKRFTDDVGIVSRSPRGGDRAARALDAEMHDSASSDISKILRRFQDEVQSISLWDRIFKFHKVTGIAKHTEVRIHQTVDSFFNTLGRQSKDLEDRDHIVNQYRSLLADPVSIITAERGRLHARLEEFAKEAGDIERQINTLRRQEGELLLIRDSMQKMRPSQMIEASTPWVNDENWIHRNRFALIKRFAEQV